MTTFHKITLFTDTDGFAKFREEPLALTEGKPQARLSTLMASGGYQLRHSPVGFRSTFHCSDHTQWGVHLERPHGNWFARRQLTRVQPR